MKKSEIYTKVVTDINSIIKDLPKATKSKILEALEVNLKPKGSGGVSLNPPKEIDGKMHYYCRWHQEYYEESLMVMSAGKSKGYCKSALSRWNKANSTIKKLDSKAVEAMTNDDFEQAKVFANESKELRAIFNLPSYFRDEKGELI